MILVLDSVDDADLAVLAVMMAVFGSHASYVLDVLILRRSAF